jgi:imidazolonepropionase-like amidohydrolase
MKYTPATTVIKAKGLIDGIGNKVLDNAAVIIQGSQITAIERQTTNLPQGPHVRHLEYPNGYLLPGFVDAHTHLMFGVYGGSYEQVTGSDSDEVCLLRAAMNAKLHIKAGVTTLRENGARNKITFDLREGADRGYLVAPRLYLCGRPVTITGGHFFWCNQEADGVEGVREAVRELVKDGADHIKIMASGGGTAITDNRRPSYTVEELRAIVDESHNMGKKTTAHCLATQSITNALDAGIDMIEHAGFRDPDGIYRYYPEIGERIAKQEVFVCPTIQTGYRQREVFLSIEAERSLTKEEIVKLDGLKAKCESQMEFMGRLWDQGVSIISGTDAIQIFGDYSLGLELQGEAGMSNMDVIKASTSTAAKCLGAENLLGSLQPGLEADLVVLNSDPVNDLRAFRDVAMVMQGGRLILDETMGYSIFA